MSDGNKDELTNIINNNVLTLAASILEENPSVPSTPSINELENRRKKICF